MMDSLAYRDDAATVLRRLIRSLPTRRGVLGIATCDKGLPAMMMALAAQKSLPCVIVPGGVTLLPEQGEDAGKINSIIRCALRTRTHHTRRSLRSWMSCLCIAWRRLSISWNRSNQSSCGRGVGIICHTLCVGTVGSSHLARYGKTIRTSIDRNGIEKDNNKRYSHRRLFA